MLNAKAHLQDVDKKLCRYEKMQKTFAWKQAPLRLRIEIFRVYGMPVLVYGAFLSSLQFSPNITYQYF